MKHLQSTVSFSLGEKGLLGTKAQEHPFTCYKYWKSQLRLTQLLEII